MIVNLDRFELLYFIEGCLIGSHLRQDIWSRCINEFYPKLSDEDRNFVFHYSVRDFTGRVRRDYKNDFDKFISRFNPDNQYKVGVRGGYTLDAFKYKDEYYTSYSTIINSDFITNTEKDNNRLEKYYDTYKHLLYEVTNKVSLIKNNIMNKYIVYFDTIHNDYDKEWCWANSPEDAKERILSEHWNIKEITHVSLMKD